jgi:hypothetical protein
MPSLSRFAREHKDIPILFLSTSSLEQNRLFEKEFEAEGVQILGIKQETADRYLVRVSPFGFLVNASGKIVAKGLVNDYAQLKTLWAEFTRNAEAAGGELLIGLSDRR